MESIVRQVVKEEVQNALKRRDSEREDIPGTSSQSQAHPPPFKKERTVQRVNKLLTQINSKGKQKQN